MNEKIFLKMDVWAVADEEEEEGFKLFLCPPSKSWWMNDGDVKLGTQSVSFFPPENLSREEMARKAIETLRDKQKQVQAEAHRRVSELEEKIKSLLMLTHQPEESNVIDLEEANV